MNAGALMPRVGMLTLAWPLWIMTGIYTCLLISPRKASIAPWHGALKCIKTMQHFNNTSIDVLQWPLHRHWNLAVLMLPILSLLTAAEVIMITTSRLAPMTASSAASEGKKLLPWQQICFHEKMHWNSRKPRRRDFIYVHDFKTE